MSGRQKRRQQKRKQMAIILVLSLAILTVLTGLVAVVTTRGELPTFTLPGGDASGGELSVSEGEDPLPPDDGEWEELPVGDGETGDISDVGEGQENVDIQQPVTFNRPSEMRAYYLTPGVDYFVGETVEETKARIDTAVSAASGMTFNTIVINPVMDGAVTYQSSYLPTAEVTFDAVAYIAEKARDEGLYVYSVYEVMGATLSGSPEPIGEVTGDTIDLVVQDAASYIRTYQLDGLLLDGYYNMESESSYQDYLRHGGGMGYEAYMLSVSDALVSSAGKAIRDAAPGTHIGLLSEAVWANQSEDESGSQTSADFTTRYDGNADTVEFLSRGYADFVAVKASGSQTDPQIPYNTVVGWWDNVATEAGTELYVVHASDRAVTDAVGWSEYDQLARQVIQAKTLSSFGGSIFNSYKRLAEDPKECTTKLVGYYQDKVKPEHILKELQITKPSQMTYTSFDQTVTFAGASDPNETVTINGDLVETNENGYFSVTFDLEPGLNQFTIVHKGKTLTYNITRQVEVLQSVSPTGALNVDGGMRITISAVAYAEAKVYAVLGGQTIPMSIVEEEDDSSTDIKDSSYRKFVGNFTAPASTASIQNLGNIVVYGQWESFQENKQGALVKINAKAVLGDGKPVIVTADVAETFPTNVINDYSDPDTIPLPKGTIDYAVGNEIIYNNGKKSYSYYKLKSNLRVYSKDIQAISDANGVANNKISGYTVKSDERHTYLILNTAQPVSFTGNYNGSAFTLEFHNTASVPQSMNLTKNPLFSSATWSGTTLTLKLSRQGAFMGHYAYYDSTGNLVFRFNNPPAVSGKDLSGVKIIVDPGHDLTDTGTLGFLNAYPESVINYEIAEQLTAVLRDRGATVVMYDTMSQKYTLEQRVLLARSNDPHIFVSIHGNSVSGDSSVRGSEAYYFNNFSSSLAKYASAGCASAIGTTNRGGKFSYYYVTRDHQFPSVLVETGFLSNEEEYRTLLDEDYQLEVAYGIANAISSYLTQTIGCDGTTVTGTQTSGSVTTTVETPNTPDDGEDSEWEEVDVGEDDSEAGGEVTKISLSDNTFELAVDESGMIEAIFEPGDADAEIIWNVTTLSGTDVLDTEEDGVYMDFYAMNPGKARITATVKGNAKLSATCTVTVTES